MSRFLFSLLSVLVLTPSTPLSVQTEKKMVIRLLRFTLYFRIKYTSWRSRFANFFGCLRSCRMPHFAPSWRSRGLFFLPLTRDTWSLSTWFKSLRMGILILVLFTPFEFPKAFLWRIYINIDIPLNLKKVIRKGKCIFFFQIKKVYFISFYISVDKILIVQQLFQNHIFLFL